MGLLFILGDVAQIIWGGTPRMLTPPGWLGTSIPLGASTYPVYRLALIVVGVAVALGSLVAGRYDDVRCPRPGGRRR